MAAQRISDQLRDGDVVTLALNDGSDPQTATVRFADGVGICIYTPSPYIAFTLIPWTAIDRVEVAVGVAA